MKLYDLSVPQFVRVLGQARVWLDKAQATADHKKFDVSVLLGARLAPDQYAFGRQLQVVCDQAKGTAARLAGVQPPAFEDNEKTIDEFRARIDKTVAWLNTLKPAQFEGAEARTITLAFIPGKGITGADFFSGMAQPNFYFHAATAYAILRHNGVDLGKRDFIGDLPLFDV